VLQYGVVQVIRWKKFHVRLILLMPGVILLPWAPAHCMAKDLAAVTSGMMIFIGMILV